jgi:hypothetical protein
MTGTVSSSPKAAAFMNSPDDNGRDVFKIEGCPLSENLAISTGTLERVGDIHNVTFIGPCVGLNEFH